MGLFKAAKDLSSLHQMSKQFERPGIGESLSMANQLVTQVTTEQHILQTGTPGMARVLSIADTGATINEHPVCELQLEVTIPGQGPYTTVVRQMVPRLQVAQLQPGSTFAVKADPQDPAQVAMDWQGTGAAMMQQAAPLAAQADAAVAAAQTAQDPVARLERLQGLRERGLLSEAEFEAQKQRILGEL